MRNTEFDPGNVLNDPIFARDGGALPTPQRTLMDILTAYEGALQEVNDDSSEENIEALRVARDALMIELSLARAWEASRE